MVKKYKEILRYFNNGFSQRQIASLTNVSRGTVIKTIDAFKALNIPWKEVRLLNDEELSEVLFPKANAQSNSLYLEPDYESLSHELMKKGVTKNFFGKSMSSNVVRSERSPTSTRSFVYDSTGFWK